MDASSPGVIYRLDGEDRIIAVNEAWQAFAAANDGAELRAPAILGQPIWGHLSDPTTAELYRQMYHRVRGHAVTVRFEFRCDSPSRRRLLGMEIAPDHDETVQISVRPTWEEARDPVALLDLKAPRDDSLLSVCGWCKQVDLGDGRWEEVEVAMSELRLFDRDTMPLISHGMCPVCHAGMVALLDDEAGESRPT